MTREITETELQRLKKQRADIDDYYRKELQIEVLQSHTDHQGKKHIPRTYIRTLVSGPKGIGKTSKINEMKEKMSTYKDDTYKMTKKNTREVDFSAESFKNYKELKEFVRGYGDDAKRTFTYFSFLVPIFTLVITSILSIISEHHLYEQIIEGYEPPGGLIPAYILIALVALIPLIMVLCFWVYNICHFKTKKNIILHSLDKLRLEDKKTVDLSEILIRLAKDSNFKKTNLIYEISDVDNELVDPALITHHIEIYRDTQRLSEEIVNTLIIKAEKLKLPPMNDEEQAILVKYFQVIILKYKFNLRKAKAETISILYKYLTNIEFFEKNNISLTKFIVWHYLPEFEGWEKAQVQDPNLKFAQEVLANLVPESYIKEYSNHIKAISKARIHRVI